MNATISRALIDVLVSVELADEDSISLEVASALVEDAATTLGGLPEGDRITFVSLIHQMDGEATEGDRRSVLRGLSEGLGLTE